MRTRYPTHRTTADRLRDLGATLRYEWRAMRRSLLARACLIAWVLLIASIYVERQITTMAHTDQIITARVQAYTAGRQQVIDDFLQPTSPTITATVSETCTAWWFGTTDKQAAMSHACKGFKNAK